MIRFILISRAGDGWIASSFDGAGRNVAIEAGSWSHIYGALEACQAIWGMRGGAS